MKRSKWCPDIWATDIWARIIGHSGHLGTKDKNRIIGHWTFEHREDNWAPKLK